MSSRENVFGSIVLNKLTSDTMTITSITIIIHNAVNLVEKTRIKGINKD